MKLFRRTVQASFGFFLIVSAHFANKSPVFNISFGKTIRKNPKNQNVYQEPAMRETVACRSKRMAAVAKRSARSENALTSRTQLELGAIGPPLTPLCPRST